MDITKLINNKKDVERWLQNNLMSKVNDNHYSFDPTKDSFEVDSDGQVDVEGTVNLNAMGLNLIPVQFRKITGSFICDYNNLSTLVGLEKLESLGGSFCCSSNNLTTLEGLENLESIGCDFNCSDNNLTTLKGLEGLKSKGRGIYCYNNFLTINEEYEINGENPGYNTTDLELIVDRFHKKVKDHNNRLKIVASLKEHKPNVYELLKDKHGYDNAWFDRNTKSKKHIYILDL